MRKVAVFDIDGTIFRSSLTIELVQALIAKGIFPVEAREEFEYDHKRWLEREGEYDAYIMAVVRTFLKYLKGVYYGDFKDAADEVIDIQQRHVYRYTRDLVKTLKADDYYLLAISHSPKAILEGFGKRYGFDKIYGKVYETGETGRFTGNILEEHLIANKANILKRAIEKEELTLEGSIGVGDTESDIPFLELVEKPICFNPNQKLYRYAKLNHWNVAVERKDVVYEL